MTPLGPVRLGELAQHLGGELRGDADALIHRLGTLETADAQTLSFLANPRYQAQLAATRAGCVIVAPALADLAAARGAALVCADPYHAFARLTQWWAARTRRPVALLRRAPFLQTQPFFRKSSVFSTSIWK